MKAITLRNLPEQLAREIRQRAAADGISLNRAVIKVLEERLRSEPLHHDLDDLAGIWSDAEARAFNQALIEQRAIDPEVWK